MIRRNFIALVVILLLGCSSNKTGGLKVDNSLSFNNKKSLIQCPELGDKYVLFCAFDVRASITDGKTNNYVYLNPKKIPESIEYEFEIFNKKNYPLKKCNGHRFIEQDYYVVNWSGHISGVFGQEFEFIEEKLPPTYSPIYLESCKRIFNHTINKINRMSDLKKYYCERC